MTVTDIRQNASAVTLNCSNVKSPSSTRISPHAEPHTNQMEKNPQQICQQTTSTSPCSQLSTVSSHHTLFTADSAVQCEKENVFKKPTCGTKRKLNTDSCMMRKSSRRTKLMATTSTSNQLDQPMTKTSIGNENSSRVTPNDRTEQLTRIIDEPDALLVEQILRCYKMPKFIEPITDNDVVIQASKRHKIDIVSLDSELMSIDLELTDLASTEIASMDSASTDIKSTDQAESESVTYDELESPASPPPFTNSSLPYQAPLVIPLLPKKLNGSVVKQILETFNTHKRSALSQRKFAVASAEEEQLLTSTRCRIEQYVVSEWTDIEIDACCSDLSNVRPGILSKCILEVVMNTKYERLSREFTPPAPVLAQSHQKIIVLIKRIGRTVNRFEDLVLFQLEKTMFVLAGEKVSISEGLNLTHLFIGLTDCMDEGSKWSCVLFVYKCLYYFAIKAIPMVYSVLMAYPTILPKFQDGDNAADLLMNSSNILQATFSVVLINTNMFEPETVLPNNGLRKKDLYTFLRKYYCFPCMQPTTNDFVDNLVSRLNSSSNLDNISYALILIAKRNGTVWADDMVQRKLLPKLNHFLLTISDGDENDERINTLVSAISSIIKTFPITNDIAQYQQIFYKLLDLTPRQTIQEEAVMALLRTTRFGMVDVYKRICDWQPAYSVSRQCYTMLCTFLYRKSLGYWRQFEFVL